MSMTTVLKWLVYGTGTVLASEVIYHVYRKWSSDPEINISIITRDPRDLRKESKYLSILYKDLEPTNVNRHACMLEKLIDSANVSINVCIYIFTSNKLHEALVRAKNRGVKVRIIMEKSMETSSGSQRFNFERADIPIRIEGKSTFHHKFMLIDVPHKRNLVSSTSFVDGKAQPFFVPKNGLLVTGSLNYTNEAMINNHENIIITSNRDLINPYIWNFFYLWDSLEPKD